MVYLSGNFSYGDEAAQQYGRLPAVSEKQKQDMPLGEPSAG